MPDINAAEKHLPTVTGLAFAALGFLGKKTVYKYGGELVRLEEDKDGNVFVQPLTVDMLIEKLSRAARWVTYKKVKGEEPEKQDAYPPIIVAKTMLANPDAPVPVLDRITGVPVFGPDGSLQTEPGYHLGSRSYYAPIKGLDVSSVPEVPTLDDLLWARSFILDELLVDFPWTDSADRAHALAMLLQPFVRELIDGPTPLFLVDKPDSRTGATLLVQVCSLLTQSYEVASTTMPPNNEEMNKTIIGHLELGHERILFDNAEKIEGQSLAAVLTSPWYEGRVLGVNRIAHLPVRCEWIVTGNNPTTSMEMSFRIVHIRLVYTGPGQPADRKDFRHKQLLRWTKEHRSEAVCAALILVRYWQACGSPRLEEPSMASPYESWSEVMGGILRHAGIPGFLTNMGETQHSGEDEMNFYTPLVEGWWQEYKSTGVVTHDLLEVARKTGIVNQWLDIDEHKQLTSLGSQIKKIRDHPFVTSGGVVRVRLHPVSTGNRQHWYLEPVTFLDQPS